jgi:ArsR family transcriptional regulator, arsenate/arsenite/antimonite-responsive transcriptional repressor
MTLAIEDAADSLAQLGNPTRLRIIRLLVKAGPQGRSVGEVQRELDVAASTLSHHLQHLKACQLVNQTREGTVLRCRANYEQLHEVTNFLLAECCAGALETQAPLANA